MRRLPVVGAVLAAVAVAMVVSTTAELPGNALLSDPEVDVVIVPTPEQPSPPTPAPQPKPKPQPQSQALVYVRPNGLAKVTAGTPAGVAIWRHPTDRRKSVVLGAAEDGGIAAYNLAGRRFLRLQGPESRLTGVDIHYRFRFDPQWTNDIAVVSDGATGRLRALAFRPVAASYGQPLVQEVTAPDAPTIFPDGSPRDVTVWQDPTGVYAVVAQESATRLALVRLTPATDRKVAFEVIRTIDLPTDFVTHDLTPWTPCGPTPIAGLTSDASAVFISQRGVGIWRINPDLTGEPTLIDVVAQFGAPPNPDGTCGMGEGSDRLNDVGALALYRAPGTTGYLIAATPGDGRFAVYTRQPIAYAGRFRIASVPATGSLAITNLSLGSPYAKGMLAARTTGNSFALIRWDELARHAGLIVNTRS
ncbi:phytase [Acrocarpospora catenulata]|uniref:phytase n=1 Tax=Acrocarpospora catenulata TaxID=2836182 RepID=UPI001BDA2E2C|nr:phytase [Acrocarpospora catenulata]